MTNQRILQIIREETENQQNLLFEGAMSYSPVEGYRNNQLIEVSPPPLWGQYGGKQLLTEGAIDTLQSLLGWAGFFPGVGDILDALNAGIFFMRNKIMDGMFSLIAVIPFVGNPVSKAIKWAYEKIGKLLGPIIKMVSKQGSKAADKLFALGVKANGKYNKLINDIILKVKPFINKFIKIIDGINIRGFSAKLKKYTAGYLHLPPSLIKSVDGFLSQVRTFFVKVAAPPATYVVLTKKFSKKKAAELSNTALAKLDDAWNDLSVSEKSKYDGKEDFIEKEHDNPDIGVVDFKKYVKTVGTKLNSQPYKVKTRWYVWYKKSWKRICEPGIKCPKKYPKKTTVLKSVPYGLLTLSKDAPKTRTALALVAPKTDGQKRCSTWLKKKENKGKLCSEFWSEVNKKSVKEGGKTLAYGDTVETKMGTVTNLGDGRIGITYKGPSGDMGSRLATAEEIEELKRHYNFA